ncbi:MAG: transcriptional repressor LexA [Methylacidiphilales bacterium]|nr:transcriptional repressor LexA [Candidatus Methylacidiphilales bacterium]
MRQSNSQQMVLAFIEHYQGENQRPPTIREIQDHCGFKSPRAVSYILEKLEQARLVIRQAHSRGIQLTKPRINAAGVQLPLFSSIPAGIPDQFDGSEAPETLRFIPTTLGISNPSRAFAVRVRGDSMVDAGIFSGDIVVLEKKEARPGDIVAALIDGENTLKRYIRENGRVYLKAENARYPRLEPVEKLEVQGVVVSVLRTMAAAA